MTVAAFFALPLVQSISAGVLVALFIALANYAVRQMGNAAKLHPRMAAVECQQAREREFQRTMLVVTGHQTAALTVLLEVTKGVKVNGNVDAALERMNAAQMTTDAYLVQTATGVA